MASKQQVLRLYKEMLRNASKFEVRYTLRSSLSLFLFRLILTLCRNSSCAQGYNFRKYAERRVKEDFHKNKSLAAGSAEQQQALAHAQEQAGVLYRQVVISKMYPPESHSIMESL